MAVDGTAIFDKAGFFYLKIEYLFEIIRETFMIFFQRFDSLSCYCTPDNDLNSITDDFNYRKKNECPMKRKSCTQNIIYICVATAPGKLMGIYLELAGNYWKKSYCNTALAEKRNK